MNVNIVMSVPERTRILPRLAHMLGDGLGWTVSGAPDPDADVNYYFPYLELRKGEPVGLSAALFTHREDGQRGDIWDRHAAQVDLRITWADQYAKRLAPYGPTAALTPPLDRQHFRPAAGQATRSRLIAGVSGYTYGSGRKGERLIKDVLQTPEGQTCEWRAVGRGWPLPTHRVTYDQLPDFYRSLDLYVCPSLVEGIPYGPLEALACGVPVVIPRGVGILDGLPDLPGIARYDCGDVQDMARAIGALRSAIQEGVTDREALRAATEPYTVEGWVRGHVSAFERYIPGEERLARAERASNAEHGIYIVAFGEAARECAGELIASIRTHMPDTPVAVASDRPVPAADLFVSAPDADLGGRTAKTRMWDLAPASWQYVLYLDADTLLTAPVPFLFDALRDGWELVCTKDVQNYELIHSLWRRDNQEHALGWEAIGSDRALQLAGGVFGFRRCENTAAFLPAWFAEWDRLARRDQGALLRALYAHPCRILVLGNEWNTFDGGICKETTEGIIHRRGGPARRRSGWPRGRLDEPSARDGQGRRVRNGRHGAEGVIEARRPKFHPQATVTVTYVGPKATRRITGRSGRAYRFESGMGLTIRAEDATPAWLEAERAAWRVGAVDCPVCHAPDGTCRGEDVATNVAAKETGMVSGSQPMVVRRQHSRYGVTGFVGEGTPALVVVDPATSSTVTPSLQAKLAALSDEELAALGLKRKKSAQNKERKQAEDKAAV